METHRFGDYWNSPASTTAALAMNAPSPFVFCPTNAPQSVMIQLAALQQAYRDLMVVAERRALQRLLASAAQTSN